MKVSSGVIVIACITFVGSTVLALFGVMMGAFIFIPMPTPNDMPNQPPFPMEFFKVIFILAALMYIAPAIWGFLSGVGLLKAKNWARISTIVFSILLICHSLFSLLITGVIMTSAFATLPSSEKIAPQVPVIVGIVLSVFWLSQTALGVWWLVFLTRPKVKAQFVTPQVQLPAVYGVQPYPGVQAQPYVSQQSATTVPGSKRPISITIIAWWILISCAFIPVNLLLRAPAVFLTKVLTGWPAAVFFLAAAGLHFYIGIGLLKLHRPARIVAIGWFVFGIINTGVFCLAPDRSARLAALLASSMKMYPWMKPGMMSFNMDLTPFMYIGMLFGTMLVAVPLYFLITRKEAFQAA